jgi:hypothetical protein
LRDASKKSDQVGQPPDCRKCRHYFITHDPDLPYGCRAMQFKSRRPPGRVVFEACGNYCLLFQPKLERQ